MLAQYEDLAIKYNKKFLLKCSVSYMKQFLTPMAIWKFGWVDELSIDSRMKYVFEKISKSGGSGGSPEFQAVKCQLRDMAVQPIVNQVVCF